MPPTIAIGDLLVLLRIAGLDSRELPVPLKAVALNATAVPGRAPYAIFVAVLSSADRPPWTPYDDPRTAALASGYGLLLAAAVADRATDLEPRAAGDQGS